VPLAPARTRQGVLNGADGIVGTPLQVHLSADGKGILRLHGLFRFANQPTPLRMTDVWMIRFSADLVFLAASHKRKGA
jgi:hypothetical protein